MVAWSDDLTWSVRDERVDFDGTTDDYTDWRGVDPELAAIRGLRNALAEFGDALDRIVKAA